MHPTKQRCENAAPGSRYHLLGSRDICANPPSGTSHVVDGSICIELILVSMCLGCIVVLLCKQWRFLVGVGGRRKKGHSTHPTGPKVRRCTGNESHTQGGWPERNSNCNRVKVPMSAQNK